MADRLTEAETIEFKARLDGLSVPALVSEHDHYLMRSEKFRQEPTTAEGKEEKRVVFGKFEMTRVELEKLKRP